MRGWLLVLVLSAVGGCASVLGLEEAELDDSSGGRAGSSGRGGNAGRGGSGGTGNATNGGSAGAADSCSFELADACLQTCWNDECCGAALACLEDTSKGCGAYLDCSSACAEGDSACEEECVSLDAAGAGLALTWATCTVGCGCDLGEGGTSGMPAPEPCTATSPTSCIGASAVRVCGPEGTYQTRTCDAACAGIAHTTGPCEDTFCRCDAPLDPQCWIGAEALCACDAACDVQALYGTYLLCHGGDAQAEPVVRCFADAAAAANFDCAAAYAVCAP